MGMNVKGIASKRLLIKLLIVVRLEVFLSPTSMPSPSSSWDTCHATREQGRKHKRLCCHSPQSL